MNEGKQKCPRCNELIDKESVFCSYCGMRIIKEDEEESNDSKDLLKEVMDKNNESMKEQTKRSRITFSYFFILFAALMYFRFELSKFFVPAIVVVFILVVLGLIKPSVILFYQEKERRTRRKVILNGFLWILCLVIPYMFLPTKVPDENLSNIEEKNNSQIEDAQFVENAKRDILIATKPIDYIDSNTNISIVLPAFEDSKDINIVTCNHKPLVDNNTLNVIDTFEITLNDKHEFKSDLAITIPIDKNKLITDDVNNLEARYYNEGDDLWEQIRSSLEEDSITLYMNHLTEIAIVESNNIKKRQPTDIFVDENAAKLLESLENVDEQKAMDELEKYGWSQSMNIIGFTGSSTTFLEHALKFESLSGGNNILKYFGATSAALQAALELNDGDKDKAFITSSKGVLNFLVSHFGSASMQIAGIGAFVIDYSLNSLANEAKALREGMLEDIYMTYYLEQGKKTPKQWYNELYEIAKDAPSKEAVTRNVEELISKYVRQIWNDDGAVSELQARMQGHGWTYEAGFTEEQKELLEKEHRAFLIQTLQPIFSTVSKNLLSDMVRNKVNYKYNLERYLSSNIPIRITSLGAEKNQNVSVKLLLLDKVIKESEKTKINDPYKSQEIALFNISVGEYIKLGCPDTVLAVLENGEKRKAKLSFFKDAYGHRASASVEFDYPNENIENDDNFYDKEDNNNEDIEEKVEDDNILDIVDLTNVDEAFLEFKQAAEYANSLDDSDSNKFIANRISEYYYDLYTLYLLDPSANKYDCFDLVKVAFIEYKDRFINYLDIKDKDLKLKAESEVNTYYERYKGRVSQCKRNLQDS